MYSARIVAAVVNTNSKRRHTVYDFMINGAEIRREHERAAADRRPLSGEQFLAGIQQAGVRIIDNRKRTKGNGSYQR